jgi:hypothetical protein
MLNPERAGIREATDKALWTNGLFGFAKSEARLEALRSRQEEKRDMDSNIPIKIDELREKPARSRSGMR